jgi:fused signal recognition particle receptor
MFNFIKNLFRKKKPSQKLNWQGRLNKSFGKSAAFLTNGLVEVLTKKKKEEVFRSLEELLISADIGVHAADKIIAKIKAENKEKLDEEQTKKIIATEVTTMLTPYARELIIDTNHKPFVIIVNGVNGSGKTTTIGKIANFYKKQNHKILLGACDTFRAAAATQLKIWADRVGCDVLMPEREGEDPAAVAHKALIKAKSENYDILIIDTAGRMHNKANLMDELGKITRVMQKIDPSAPQASLLVLDGTTGQNAKKQLEVFQEIVKINGLIISKLDGTAKGGIVISLTTEFQTPAYFIGIGEGINDLKPFQAKDFAESMLG